MIPAAEKDPKVKTHTEPLHWVTSNELTGLSGELASHKQLDGKKLTMDASLVAQRLKRLPAMRETWVRSLGGENPLEKELATHSVLLPGESHGQRSLVGYSPWAHKVSETTERLHFQTKNGR